MANRISEFTEKRIGQLWFEGYSRDEIARRVDVSGSSVSRVVGEFPESSRPLRAISMEISKLNLSVSETRKGVELVSKLAQLDIGIDRLQESIQAVETICEEAGYRPKEVIHGAVKLLELENQSGKSYPEALRSFQATRDNIEKLKNAYMKGGVTERNVCYTVRLRKNFKKFGVFLKDVKSLREYLENMHATGGDPERFVDFTKKHGSLTKELIRVRNEIRAETANLQRMKQERQNAIAETQRLQNQASQARLLDVDILERRRTLQALEQRAQILQDKCRSIEIEIMGWLGLRSYVVEPHTTVSAPEPKKEICQQQDRPDAFDIMMDSLSERAKNLEEQVKRRFFSQVMEQ